MDNEKINGVPEEETEVQTEEIQEPETTEEVNETVTEDTAEEESAEAEETETVEEETEEAEEEEISEETAEKELCLCCGEKLSEDGSDYCADCEATMLSRKIPFLGWACALVVIVMSVFALGLATVVAAPSIKVSRGDQYARENCWYSAYKEYSDVNSVIAELNSIIGEETPFIQMGTGLVYRIIDTVANTASPLDAISVADSLLGSNSTENHPALKKYSKLRAEYMATYTVAEPTLTVMQYGESSFKTTKESFENCREKEGVNDVLIDYFIFTASVFFAEDVAVRLECLEAVDKSAKESGEDYSWLYYQDYADVLFEAGKAEEALEYLNVLIENDKTKFGAYELKIRIALANGNVDEASAVLEEFKKYNEGYDTAYVLEATLLRVAGKTEEAKILLTDALEEYDSVPELHRQLALIYLLEGDVDAFYSAVDNAVYNALYLYNYMNDRSTITAQLINTAFICELVAEKNGSSMAGTSAWIMQLTDGMLESDLPERALAAVNGEITWTELLTEGECDIL